MLFDKKALDKAMMDRVAMQLDLNTALEEAIKTGKEFTLILEEMKPVTRCLVAHVMANNYRRLFPKVFEAFEKLGI